MILNFVQAFLSLKILGNAPLIWFMSGASMVSVINSSLSTYTIYQRRPDSYDQLSPNQQLSYKASKWRMERNWWISLMSLFVWFLLWKLFKTLKRCERLEDNLLQCQKEKEESERIIKNE